MQETKTVGEPTAKAVSVAQGELGGNPPIIETQDTKSQEAEEKGKKKSSFLSKMFSKN